jgi:hypothetical protein
VKSSTSSFWTNESVLAFAGGRDPVAAIEDAAQQLVLDAVENQWKGPPFDPFELARILNIPVVPKQELPDARTVPAGTKIRIEYNPTRPPQRLRFSIAHEIAHTLFPDVADAARYRNSPTRGPADAWQLELLCNIAADRESPRASTRRAEHRAAHDAQARIRRLYRGATPQSHEALRQADRDVRSVAYRPSTGELRIPHRLCSPFASLAASGEPGPTPPSRFRSR